MAQPVDGSTTTRMILRFIYAALSSTDLFATLSNILATLVAGGSVEDAIRDVEAELVILNAAAAAPMEDTAWVSEGAVTVGQAATWVKVPMVVPADSRKLGMFSVDVDTPGAVTTLDYCWTYDEAGSHRITNNEAMAIDATTLNPDGATYSKAGGLGNVANKLPSYGVANTVWFWHRCDAAAGNVAPTLHGEL